MHDVDQRRWQFHDPWLLFLFPASYAIHIVEEATVDAPILLWTAVMAQPLPIALFLTGNAIALLLMTVGVWLVPRGAAFRWIAPAVATAVLLNTAGHLVGSVLARAYSAGLMSAVVLWVPLGMLTMLRVWDQASYRTLVAGVVVGIVIEGIVLLFSTLSNLFAIRPV